MHSSVDIGFDDGGKLKLPSLDCRIEANHITSGSGTLINIINPSPTLQWKDNVLLPRDHAKLGLRLTSRQATIIAP